MAAYSHDPKQYDYHKLSRNSWNHKLKHLSNDIVPHYIGKRTSFTACRECYPFFLLFFGKPGFHSPEGNEALSSPCKVNLKHSDTHLQLYGKHYHLQLQHEDSKCFQLQPKKVASK